MRTIRRGMWVAVWGVLALGSPVWGESRMISECTGHCGTGGEVLVAKSAAEPQSKPQLAGAHGVRREQATPSVREAKLDE
jgi:hypothetical protein